MTWSRTKSRSSRWPLVRSHSALMPPRIACTVPSVECGDSVSSLGPIMEPRDASVSSSTDGHDSVGGSHRRPHQARHAVCAAVVTLQSRPAASTAFRLGRGGAVSEHLSLRSGRGERRRARLRGATGLLGSRESVQRIRNRPRPPGRPKSEPKLRQAYDVGPAIAAQTLTRDRQCSVARQPAPSAGAETPCSPSSKW